MHFLFARVNDLRFQCDFSGVVAAISQEFRLCSNLGAILRQFFTKLNHKGSIGTFCQTGFQFVFVWSWLIQTKSKGAYGRLEDKVLKRYQNNILVKLLSVN